MEQFGFDPTKSLLNTSGVGATGKSQITESFTDVFEEMLFNEEYYQKNS